LIEEATHCVDDTCHDFTDKELENFYKSEIGVDLAKSVNIQIAGQNSQVWRKERQVRITASNCYQIFTYSKNRNADWTKKFNNINKGFVTEATEYGKTTEKLAFQRYQIDEPLVKMAGLCVNPKQPWLGCSPDGVITSKRRIIEIKCPKAFEKNSVSLKECKFLRCDPQQTGPPKFSLKTKHAYYGQIQLNLYLLNCESADLVIYSKFDDNYERIRVDFDDIFVTTMLSSLKDVFFYILLPLIYNKK
jgi:YqaJ-like viral recombinase domain